MAHREDGEQQKHGDGPRDDFCCAGFLHSCHSAACQPMPPLAFWVVLRPFRRACHAWWADWAHGCILAGFCIPGTSEAHAVCWPLHASRRLPTHGEATPRDQCIFDSLMLTNCACDTGNRFAAAPALSLWAALTAGTQMLQLLRSMAWCGSDA